jgi:CheY-like chemotaxis protein
MRVLILEDSPERIKVFQKQLKDHDLYFFDNVRDAIRAIEFIGEFEFFFIDHDLDNKVFVSSQEENTGYQFAKYLKEKGIVKDTVIHSMNPVGSQNIKAILPWAQIVPFPSLFS